MPSKLSIRSWLRRRENQTFKYVDLRKDCGGAVDAFYTGGGKVALINVALKNCRWYGGNGCAYDSESRHPYVRTLIEYLNGACEQYKNSYLECYWSCWQPVSHAESLGISAETAHPLLIEMPPLHDVMPWSAASKWDFVIKRGWMDKRSNSEMIAENSPPARSCGPKPEWFGEARFNDLIEICKSIAQNGYQDKPQPEKPYKHQHILANCLLRDGEERYVIANGQHRTASLSALGYKEAPVLVHTLNGRGPAVVRRDEVYNWPLVQKGLFNEQDALAVFDRIFKGEMLFSMG